MIIYEFISQKYYNIERILKDEYRMVKMSIDTDIDIYFRVKVIGSMHSHREQDEETEKTCTRDGILGVCFSVSPDTRHAGC